MFSMSQLLLIPALLLLRFLISLTVSSFPVRGVNWSQEASKWHHPMSRLEDHELRGLATFSDYNDFNQTLDSILIPRVPGTEGHERVRKYIVSSMKALDWGVEEDSFTDRTPYGKKPFSNIVATLNPHACRFLTVACHYDSLHNREYTFLGAIDSAVPCAMMINAARVLDTALKEQTDKNNEISLQFIFFDGEEAFKRWGPNDSLYGSRHLAAKWDRMQPFPNGLNDGRHCTSKDYASYLDRMDVMMLLDLIGTANPKFYSYFPDTYGLYSHLVDVAFNSNRIQIKCLHFLCSYECTIIPEQRLNSLKLVEAHPPESTTYYFDRRSTLAFVEDDHVPFMKRGVPILHLIPTPFPHVWHRESDNRQNLHHPTIDNLNKILRVFIAQYLHLDNPNLDIMK